MPNATRSSWVNTFSGYLDRGGVDWKRNGEKNKVTTRSGRSGIALWRGLSFSMRRWRRSAASCETCVGLILCEEGKTSPRRMPTAGFWKTSSKSRRSLKSSLML